MKILHGSTPPAMRDMPARPHASAVGDACPAEGSFPARRAPSRSPAEGSVKTAVRTALIGLVRGYRLVVSPLFPPCCRYYPSCSAYALQAIRLHGPILGGWLALKRLSRCHPWNPGGYDPVPARTSESLPGLPGEPGGRLS